MTLNATGKALDGCEGAPQDFGVYDVNVRIRQIET